METKYSPAARKSEHEPSRRKCPSFHMELSGTFILFVLCLCVGVRLYSCCCCNFLLFVCVFSCISVCIYQDQTLFAYILDVSVCVNFPSSPSTPIYWLCSTRFDAVSSCAMNYVQLYIYSFSSNLPASFVIRFSAGFQSFRMFCMLMC